MLKSYRGIKEDKVIRGVMYMIIHAIALSTLYIFSKELTHSLHSNQVAFLYKFAIFIALIPWVIKGGFKNNLKTDKLGMHVARGTFSSMGSLCFFYALSKLNTLDATAISYLEHILVLFIGIIFFKEKLNTGKIIFVICGAIGALFILKPGFQEFNHNYVYIFLALGFWAGNNVMIKILGRTEHSKAQLFYVMMFSSAFALPMALQVWKPLELWHFKYLTILAICYLIHVAAFFKAFKQADMSTVIPFDYTRLLFTGILGFIVLGEKVEKYSIIGYCFIAIGGIYLVHREAKKKFKKRQDSNIAAIENEYEQV